MTTSLPPEDYFRFCPRCSAPLTVKSTNGKPLLICSTGDFTFFQNPKTTVCALVFNNQNEILLTQRAIEPAKGWWDVPGGFVDAGEDAEQALIREMAEELGVIFSPAEILGAYHSWYPSQGLRESVMNIYYLGNVAGALVPADDVSAFGWYALDALPKNLCAIHLKFALKDWGKRRG